MLKEINLKQALQAYLNGEIVLAMVPEKEEEGRLFPIERLFDQSRFLVEERTLADKKPAVPARCMPVPNGGR